MEARRYRYYEIWSSRVAYLRPGTLPVLAPESVPPDEAWPNTSPRICHATLYDYRIGSSRTMPAAKLSLIFALLALWLEPQSLSASAPARDFSAS